MSQFHLSVGYDNNSFKNKEFMEAEKWPLYKDIDNRNVEKMEYYSSRKSAFI